MANPDTPGAAQPAESTLTLAKPEPAWRAWLGRGWSWMLLACVVLAASGAARAIQQQQIARAKSVFEPCPFPLADMPLRFGDWESQPDDVEVLDDQTIRITGSTDRIVRRYVNKYIGVQITALVLYGPAEPVIPHTPDVCFPANGYGQDGPVTYAEVAVGKQKVPFRTAAYTKSAGGKKDRVRSYYSFRLNDGGWSPDVGGGKQFYRSNPGVFKVQIQRKMSDGERAIIARDGSKGGAGIEPIEDFLVLMLDNLEERIAARQSSGGKTAAADPQRGERNSRSVEDRDGDADRPRFAMVKGMN